MGQGGPRCGKRRARGRRQVRRRLAGALSALALSATLAAGALSALALSATLAAGAPCAEAPPAPPNPEALKDATIVIFGQPYTGSLIPPATETEFTFKVRDSGELLTFRWASLEADERRRVQKLMGITPADEPGKAVWGEAIQCVRLRLATGRVVEGLEISERARPGFRCLKTASQVLMVPLPDIRSEEAVVKHESDLFSPEEGYDRLVARKPPGKDSAQDQLELGRTCFSMGLLEKALEHFDLAKVLDPRTEEQTAELRATLVEKMSRQLADGVYAQLQAAVQREDFAGALVKCDEFVRNFPQDERRTKVESMREEILPRKETNFTRQVIRLYYQYARDLLHARLARRTQVDAQGRPVPSIPGKEVITRQSRRFRGTLVSQSPEKVVIKEDERTCEIPAQEVISIQDIDLSKGVRSVEPTFAELKAYATDAAGGLGKDVVVRIAQMLSSDEAKIRETWDGRLRRTAVMKDGILEAPPVYTSVHTASYGKGTWLREGVSAVSPTRTGLPRRTGRRTTGGSAAASANPADPANADPEYSDDPEVWWRVQSGETKFGILSAFAAEKLFKVREVRAETCRECAGRGVLEVLNQPEPQPCMYCRGLKNFITIVYE
jgi:hypothetical protein